MRRLIGFILLSVAFLGGYHLGRQENSPDLIGHARQAAVTVAAVAGDIYESVTDSDGASAGEGEDPAEPVVYDRPGVDPHRDTRVYVHQYRSSRHDRYAEPAPAPGVDDTQAVAQARRDDEPDLAGRIWRALQPPADNAR